jgi:hypothetical protein
MNKSYRIDILVIIVMGIFSYGLQIPSLGFFQDDWNFVFYSSARGSQGLLEFLIIDGRPGATWIYTLGFTILGYKPYLWQLFSITLRVLTTIYFWLVLKNLWPARRYGNLVTAIVFLAYPFFTLLPLSVAYAPHLAAYFLYSLSMFLMVSALEKPEKYVLYTSIAVLCTFIQLFTVEYFVGLELLRPLVVWFFLSTKLEITKSERLRKILLMWLPYLIALIFFVIWRSVFLPSLGVRNDPLLLLHDSGQVVIPVIKNMGADLVLMLFSSWFKLLNPELFVIGPIRNYYVLAASLIGAGCFYYLAKLAASRESETIAGIKGVFLAGIIAFAAGMVPAYVVGYNVHLKLSPWNSRFSLPALMGLALMASALIEITITAINTRRIFIAILIGLLVGAHNQNTLDFKSAWEKQERFYQQLIWRAPVIRPNTAIIANEEILGYMGDYPTSFGINTIYEAKQVRGIPYWFFALSENFNNSADLFISGRTIGNVRGTTAFQGDSRNAIFITYEPENKQCLWVLRPQDSEYKHLPLEMKKAVLISSGNNISAEEAEHNLFHEIVKENKDTWCYFYQRADLARQMSNWDSVINLWEEAKMNNHRPDNGFEYLPFIEGYAHLGDWENAFLLTKTANTATPAMYFILCPRWRSLYQDTIPFGQKDIFTNKAYDLLKCSQ